MAYNILIVDDSQTMRRVIRKSVTLAGFDLGECWEAGDGREALTVLKTHAVDLILTDFNMPGMDGMEMLKELQKDEKNRHVPVVLITAQDNARVVPEGSALGIKGYLQKPFQPEAICKILSQVMEKNRV
ncbi:MAG: response regulator [Deltaproteobacteria bacterium]|nr:response regulator [Deltaproteobacteria bacterium]